MGFKDLQYTKSLTKYVEDIVPTDMIYVLETIMANILSSFSYDNFKYAFTSK